MDDRWDQPALVERCPLCLRWLAVDDLEPTEDGLVCPECEQEQQEQMEELAQFHFMGEEWTRW